MAALPPAMVMHGCKCHISGHPVNPSPEQEIFQGLASPSVCLSLFAAPVLALSLGCYAGSHSGRPSPYTPGFLARSPTLWVHCSSASSLRSRLALLIMLPPTFYKLGFPLRPSDDEERGVCSLRGGASGFHGCQGTGEVECAAPGFWHMY